MNRANANPSSTDAGSDASHASVVAHDDPRVIAALEEFLQQCESASPPSISSFVSAYPEIQSTLQDCLVGLAFVRDATPRFDLAFDGANQSFDRELTSQPLGDFRLVREIGRGGMGVVYEAEQLSLGRPVALKILPFASLLDSRQLVRFRNESRAAAMLKHPRIVNVIQTGCDRGVHYYAMELVDGKNLATIIQELRSVAASRDEGQDRLESSTPRVASSAETAPFAQLTTEYSSDPKRFCRNVARLGMEAAAALYYAHQEGVIHRDIKPSNLLLDARGKPWITDFGLAHIQGADDLTLTGDLLGTARYMSPEQAQGDRLLDQRTDVYSLGVTLYELLTLKAAFGGEDRPSLLHEIVHHEPVPPRQLNRALDVDLQTIVLKSIAKDPNDRYATAQDLADDLERYLDQRPIRARSLGRAARIYRWCRRSPMFAGLVAAVVFLLLCVTITAVAFAFRETAHRQQAEQRTEEAEWQQYAADMHSAMAAWEQSNVPRAKELLERHRPRPGAPDLRGFEWNYLWRRCQDPRLLRQISEIAFVRGLAVSHDQRLLATANDAGLARIWNPFDGSLVDEIKATPIIATRVAFSRDDQRLAIGDGYGTIQIWDRRSSHLLHTLVGHTDNIVGIQFNDDGQQLVSGSLDGTIRLWDTRHGSELRTIRPSSPYPTPAFPLPPWTDNHLWVHGWSGILRLFDTQSGRELNRFERPELADVQSVARISWDGHLAATGGIDGVVRLFETATGRELPALGGHATAVRALAFAPGDQLLASSDNHGKVVVWDLAERKPRVVLRGSNGQIWRLEFLHDGQWLCTSGSDRQVRIWDLTPSFPVTQDVCKLGANILTTLAFSPDGRWVAAGGVAADEGIIEVLDVATGRLEHQINVGSGYVWGVAFSPDGQELASTSEDGIVRLWNLPKLEPLRTIDAGKGHAIHWVCYSRDGRELITTQYGGMLHVFNRTTGKVIRAIKLDPPLSPPAALSRDGRMLVVARDDAIHLLNYPSLESIRRIPATKTLINAIAMSPDGRIIATCDNEHRVLLTSLDGTELGTLDHPTQVTSLDFSPDGSTLVTGDFNHDIHVWDVNRRQERVVLRGHNFWIESVQFSPNGKTIASTGDDGTVRLWRSDRWN